MRKKQEKAKRPTIRIVLLLFFFAVAGLAYYNWPTRNLVTDADGKDEAKEKLQLPERAKTVSPELSNDQYRESMKQKDKKMIERRRAEQRRLRKKFSLKNSRDLYGNQKEELEGIISTYGADSAPNSITHEAQVRLRQLESDAPY